LPFICVCVRFGFNAAPAHHNHSLATGLIFWVRLKLVWAGWKKSLHKWGVFKVDFTARNLLLLGICFLCEGR